MKIPMKYMYLIQALACYESVPAGGGGLAAGPILSAFRRCSSNRRITTIIVEGEKAI